MTGLNPSGFNTKFTPVPSFDLLTLQAVAIPFNFLKIWTEAPDNHPSGKSIPGDTARTTAMKALCFHQHGGLDLLRYEDAPDPKPGKGEVLVQVKACALNHLDIWVMRGWPGLDLEMPHSGR